MVYLATGNPASHNNGSSSAIGGSAGGNGTTSASERSSHDDRDPEDSSDGEREGTIRVGKDYQASIPPFIDENQRHPSQQCPERALLVWSPSPHITTSKLDEYIQISKEKYGYNAEQALGMLFWHKHDLDRAVQDLANFTPFPDEWSVEDKVLFEQAFQFHGKSFHRIRQMLPDKTIEQLVKYYYGWKETRTRTSLMDRQARKLQAQREDKGNIGAEEINDNESDESETPAPAASSGIANASGGAAPTSASVASPKPKCFNCGILCHVTHATPKGQMCGTCYQYYNRTGHVRPTTAPMRKDGTKSKHTSLLFKNGNRPPKGMHVNHDDLVALATGPATQGEQLLKSMDREIVSYKRNVQNNKQYLSALLRRAKEKRLEPYTIPSPPSSTGAALGASSDETNEESKVETVSKINPKWTQEELLLGVEGIRKFGKNFKVIAEIIGTKTESHLRSFFVNYRRKYNLDAALKDYEAEHGTADDESDGSNGAIKLETNGSSAATKA